MENNILWTSGWDSTFRVIQLARKGAIIQPYYVIDTKRASTNIEIERMNDIKILISERYRECTIKPIKYILKEEINNCINIDKSYEELRKDNFIGNQYIWLGYLSKVISNLELCIHKDDKAHYIIKDYINTKKYNNEDIYAIDENCKNTNIKNVFGKLLFPILEYSKEEMKLDAENNGYIDIMLKTWFCHNPINGEECGICNPCKYSIEEGMSFRFSKRALKRNKNQNIYKLISKIYRKII